jgi:hypothetical protein
MAYDWMITFADLTDELIKKRGDNYLQTYPDKNNNYYDLTAAKFINFINSFNLDVSVMNAQSRAGSSPPHYLVIQWLITCLQMLVCQNNIGINNVDMGVNNDIYYIKYKHYNADLMVIQGNLKYETIVNGMLQQNYTRAGNSFRIMY